MKAIKFCLIALTLLVGAVTLAHASVDCLVATGKVPALAPPSSHVSPSSGSDAYSSFNIDVGRKFCSGSAVTPDNQTVYVMNYDTTISVVDAVNNVFVKTIDFAAHSPGSISGGIVVGNYLYAVGSSNVVVMDINTEQVVSTVAQSPAGGVVWGRAVASPSKDRVYTIFGSTATMLAIDTTSHQLINSASTGNENTGIGVSPDGAKTYASDRVNGNLTVVDTSSFSVISVKSYLTGTGIVAYTTAVSVGFDGLVYVGYVDGNYSFNVAICDADGNLVDTIFTGSFSTGLDLSLDGNYLTTGNGKIIDVTTKTVVDDVATGSGEYQVNMSQDGLRAYVTNYNSTYITVIEGYEVNVFTLSIYPDPLLGGQNGNFSVTNGNPNTTTFLGYSLVGTGSTYVPVLDVTLDLASPKQGGSSITTDANGDGSWTLPVPASAIGRNVWLQAVQFQNKTNVVASSIQ